MFSTTKYGFDQAWVEEAMRQGLLSFIIEPIIVASVKSSDGTASWGEGRSCCYVFQYLPNAPIVCPALHMACAVLLLPVDEML
jgi:hypothetical protein